MNSIIFKAINLSKKYKEDFALNNVNMEIKQGDIYGFVGENGAGKTTLIRILTGLVFKTSGEFSLFNETNEKLIINNRRRIGSIIENPAIYPDMSAKENLEIYRIQKGIPGKDCINKVLEIVKLNDTGRKKAKNFSLGMKQRLGLAIALLNDPEFLILDEPTNGLDPIGIVELRELLKKLNKERNITILISSHILSELYQLATCYGFIHKGKMLEQITVKELDEKCKKHIYIKVDNPAKAVSVIETKLLTQKFEVYPNNIIKLYDFLDNSSKVSRELSLSGVIVEEITLKGDDLESYFIRLIGGKINV